jgi:zinc protease
MGQAIEQSVGAGAVRRAGPAGSLLIVESHRATPLVHLVVAARTGSANDPRRKEGLTNLAAELARRGAGKRSREQIDEALDALGATLEVATEADSVRFEGQVLSRHLDAFLALLSDIVLRPTFAPAELARTRRELIAQIDETRNDDQALCARFFSRNLYGDHPYGHPPIGTRASLEPLTQRELATHFTEQFVGKNLIFAAAGDVDPGQVAGKLNAAFAGMREGSVPARPAESREPQGPAGWRIQLVDKPDRQQTQIMFGHPALRATDPDFLPFQVAIASFGGHGMSSTLMNEVRTKRGLAYGAYMSLSQRRGRGAAVGWVLSGNEKAVATLKLVLKLYVGLMDKGLDAQRIEFWKSFLAGAHASEIDAPEQRLEARISAEIAGLPPDFVDRYPERVRAVTPAAVAAAVKRHLRARDLAITMVSTAAVMHKLLVESKVQETAIDIVPFESY